MQLATQSTGRLGQRPRRLTSVGWWVPAGGLLAGLVVLGCSAPAGAQTITRPMSSTPSPSRPSISLGSVSATQTGPAPEPTGPGLIASAPQPVNPLVTGTAPEPTDPGVVQTGGDPAPTGPGVIASAPRPAVQPLSGPQQTNSL
jgi:hypothetical protein